jgi:hypothetical protein
MEQRGIFMEKAKRIGGDLSQTFLKLEKLSISSLLIFFFFFLLFFL